MVLKIALKICYKKGETRASSGISLVNKWLSAPVVIKLEKSICSRGMMGRGRWNDKNLSHFFAIYSSGLSAVVVVVVKGEIRAKLQMNAMNVASDGGFFASCHSLYEQSFRARYTEKKTFSLHC
jgi:hypothetical protein